jgi:hypothetical protein
MKSFIDLVFNTDAGRDLKIRISDADGSVTAPTVNSAMFDIASENILAGVENIVGPKAASLFKVDSKTIDIS